MLSGILILTDPCENLSLIFSQECVAILNPIILKGLRKVVSKSENGSSLVFLVLITLIRSSINLIHTNIEIGQSAWL
jgi:hypothetical protein